MRHCQFGKLTGVICLTNRKYGAKQWIVTSIRCTLLTKKVVPSKAEQGQWAIRLARKWDWELPHLKCPTCFRCAWRIGSSCFEGQRSDGKAGTTYNVQRTEAITMPFDGGQASVLIDAEKSAESLAQAVGTWNLKRWQSGFGEWAGDVKKLEESRLPQGADIQAHAHHLKDRSKWVKIDLTFQLPLFFFCFFLSKVRHWVHGLLCIWFLATSLSLANLIFF